MAEEQESLDKTLKDYKSQVAPDMKGTLTLDRDLVFVGRTARGETVDFDAKVEWGLMPTESMLLSIGACLAIDVVAFVRKMRAEVTDFKMDMTAKRNPTPPQYFKAVELKITITGKHIDERKMDRAIALSKEKYCSVYHTLRKDLEHTVSYEIVNK